jgi:hypothetical protein
MENLVDDVQSHWLQYNMVLYCVKDYNKGKHLDECYSYIQERHDTRWTEKGVDGLRHLKLQN